MVLRRKIQPEIAEKKVSYNRLRKLQARNIRFRRAFSRKNYEYLADYFQTRPVCKTL